jgi:hypothetical protein
MPYLFELKREIDFSYKLLMNFPQDGSDGRTWFPSLQQVSLPDETIFIARFQIVPDLPTSAGVPPWPPKLAYGQWVHDRVTFTEELIIDNLTGEQKSWKLQANIPILGDADTTNIVQATAVFTVIPEVQLQHFFATHYFDFNDAADKLDEVRRWLFSYTSTVKETTQK